MLQKLSVAFLFDSGSKSNGKSFNTPPSVAFWNINQRKSNGKRSIRHSSVAFSDSSRRKGNGKPSIRRSSVAFSDSSRRKGNGKRFNTPPSVAFGNTKQRKSNGKRSVQHFPLLLISRPVPGGLQFFIQSVICYTGHIIGQSMISTTAVITSRGTHTLRKSENLYPARATI